MQYDYVIIGAGIGGLFTGALLAQSGNSVCILEQHLVPGGYGHSFKRKGYTFCAELHYIWNVGQNEDMGHILRLLEINNDVAFTQLNEECYDRFDFPGFTYKLGRGFKNNVIKLSKIFPDHRKSIETYYYIIGKLHDEMKALPLSLSLGDILLKIQKYKNIIKYRHWTTQKLFDYLKFPHELQSILAGQSGNLLVPPNRASLLVHSAMVTGLDKGASVPTISYRHVFETVVKKIQSTRNCKVKFKTEIISLQIDKNRVTRAITKNEDEFLGRNFIFNGDPNNLFNLLPKNALGFRFRKKLNYSYSPSAFTVYLGIKNLDLTNYGFGAWNVWNYSSLDINKIFIDQLDDSNFDNPSLFISTPTLHRNKGVIAPQNCDQMVICTMCDYNYFSELMAKGKESYLKEKERITKLILEKIKSRYIDVLYDHLDIVEAGTPLTMERFVFTPMGNSYGADLTPENYRIGKINYKTPIKNLFLVGATACIPSFAGGIHFSGLLFEKLTGYSLFPK